ncbi:hypothetical protein [Marinobacterium jannaschii]|uniref:hypothetical protein n=1 Tax=Marinobacterium jannaschii TaxID=64970 RepID=UPI000489AD97|nr:hypothetical protein [Marinobacterium jannaschii]
MENNDFEELLCVVAKEVTDNAKPIECEEGSGAFVSVGAVNSAVSKMRRAIHDPEYRASLISGA